MALKPHRFSRINHNNFQITVRRLNWDSWEKLDFLHSAQVVDKTKKEKRLLEEERMTAKYEYMGHRPMFYIQELNKN